MNSIKFPDFSIFVEFCQKFIEADVKKLRHRIYFREKL